MGLLKGCPSLLCPLLYICAAASRCIVDANADSHVIDQCGNPILPTFCLTIFLFWTWFITVLVPPIWHREMITWSDIARWSIASDSSREGVRVRRHVLHGASAVRDILRGRELGVVAGCRVDMLVRFFSRQAFSSSSRWIAM